MKSLRHYWLQGKNSLLTILAAAPGKSPALLTMPQLAFAAIGPDNSEAAFSSSGTRPRSRPHFQPLAFLQNFFNTITDIQDASLLPATSRLLLPLTNGHPLVFAEYQRGKLIIHTSCRIPHRDNIFTRELIQSCRNTYRKARPPVDEQHIQFKSLGTPAELAETEQSGGLFLLFAI